MGQICSKRPATEEDFRSGDSQWEPEGMEEDGGGVGPDVAMPVVMPVAGAGAEEPVVQERSIRGDKKTKMKKKRGKGIVHELRKISSNIGERSLEMLDSIPSSGGGGRVRGDRRVEILAFEVANLCMRVMSLRVSLFEEEMSRFKEDVLKSEGVQRLVSNDMQELWMLAAVDRRHELSVLAKEVARLGKLSRNAALHNLDEEFQCLGSQKSEAVPRLSADEVESQVDWMQMQVTSTADLYHELHALDSARAGLQRHITEEERFPGTQKDTLKILKQELREQESSVKALKRKTFWSQRLDHVVDSMRDLVYVLYDQLQDAFRNEGVPDEAIMWICRLGSPPPHSDPNRLGVSGLALHYANIITSIDNMVSHPSCVSTAARESLFQMLPSSIAHNFKRSVRKADRLGQESVTELRATLENQLDWLMAMASNSIRWTSDRRLQGHSDLYLMQTLHYADQAKSEAALLDLMLGLHFLVTKSKPPGNGQPPSRAPSRGPLYAPVPQHASLPDPPPPPSADNTPFNEDMFVRLSAPPPPVSPPPPSLLPISTSRGDLEDEKPSPVKKRQPKRFPPLAVPVPRDGATTEFLAVHGGGGAWDASPSGMDSGNANPGMSPRDGVSSGGPEDATSDGMRRAASWADWGFVQPLGQSAGPSNGDGNGSPGPAGGTLRREGSWSPGMGGRNRASPSHSSKDGSGTASPVSRMRRSPRSPGVIRLMTPPDIDLIVAV